MQKCAVSIRDVNDDLWQVCRDSDVLFSASRIGLLPCSSISTTTFLRKWQRNKRCLKTTLIRRASHGK